MTKKTINFNFPPDIKLKTDSLVEAWLTIHWELLPDRPGNQLFIDPGYSFKLIQNFFTKVGNRFPNIVELDANKAPIELTPYRPRFQFRANGNDGWPLIHLGPGVASVNYSPQYTWAELRESALYLREQLVAVYAEAEYPIKLETLNLRYRNALPFEHSKLDFLKYVRQNLNTTLRVPPHIPGDAGSFKRPVDVDIKVTYELREPKGIGSLRLATGEKNIQDSLGESQPKEYVVLFETDVLSRKPDGPDINNASDFEAWLTSAHLVLHDWYFSLIDGTVYKQFSGEVD